MVGLFIYAFKNGMDAGISQLINLILGTLIGIRIGRTGEAKRNENGQT